MQVTSIDKTWVKRIKDQVGDPVHGWSRPLRMASDCSGVGTPEIAWTESVGKAVHLFVSDKEVFCKKHKFFLGFFEVF